MSDTDTRDRLIRLEAKFEAKFEHFEARFEHLEKANAVTDQKVTEMHDLLMQARGARWMIAGLATIGGAAAAVLAKVVTAPVVWK